MPKLFAASALVATLALVPALSRAQEDDAYAVAEDDAYAVAENEVTPDGAAPAWTPPPPAEAPPAPQAQQAPVPPGQWVYTAQYGWIWMPYADAYTRVPTNGSGEPYAYVYYPAYSTWTWVAAPWVWGYGPWPVFGVWGPARFAWYGHGWWRSPARWHYAPAHAWYGGHRPAPAYTRGGAWSAPRFAPSRGGYGAVRGSVMGGPVAGGHAFVGGHGGGGRGGGGHGGGHGRGHGGPQVFRGGGHGR